MAYFPNGTSGMNYEAEYCDKCIHNCPNFGCPIMNAHLLFNYDQIKKPEIAAVLDMLIPRSDNGLSNKKCRFFQKHEMDLRR